MLFSRTTSTILWPKLGRCQTLAPQHHRVSCSSTIQMVLNQCVSTITSASSQHLQWKTEALHTGHCSCVQQRTETAKEATVTSRQQQANACHAQLPPPLHQPPL